MNSNSKISGLYVITDPNLMGQHDICDKVRSALQGGAKIVQFRDKTSCAGTKLQQAKQLQQLCSEFQATFIINDDIQLAKQACADGVHIGKDDDDIVTARKLLGEDAIIGVSCYNDLQRAEQMQSIGASYVAFGRFYPSKTKPNAPAADLATLSTAKQKLTVPIVAIGGIDKQNAAQLISAGADSLAVIQGVFAQADIKDAAIQIQNQFEL